jgi:hypothetical protein
LVRCEIDPSGGRTERRWWSKDLFIEEENRRLESSCRLAKSRGLLDLGEGTRRLTLRRGRTIRHCISANQDWWMQESHARRDREVRSPDLIGAVVFWRDRWHESGASGFRHSGFPAAGTLESRTRDPRNPDVTWQCGTAYVSGIQVALSREIGISVLGVLCCMRHATTQPSISR